MSIQERGCWIFWKCSLENIEITFCQIETFFIVPSYSIWEFLESFHLSRQRCLRVLQLASHVISRHFLSSRKCFQPFPVFPVFTNFSSHSKVQLMASVWKWGPRCEEINENGVNNNAHWRYIISTTEGCSMLIEEVLSFRDFHPTQTVDCGDCRHRGDFGDGYLINYSLADNLKARGASASENTIWWSL